MAELTGQTTGHLVETEQGAMHREVLESWQRLQAAAKAEGIDLCIASGFRSYERQCAIWQAKAEGRRPLLGDDGQPLDEASLSDQQRLAAILRWSAMPGCSRHHWGTDFDVYDAAAVADGYALQLVPAEYAEGGPFHHLNGWLQSRIDAGDCYGFMRPYCEDMGGVAVEPWHISHQPVAARYQQRQTEQWLSRWLGSQSWPLASLAAEDAAGLYQRYIKIRP